MAFSSARNWASSAGLKVASVGLLGATPWVFSRNPLGMSCQTSMPSSSQWR